MRDRMRRLKSTNSAIYICRYKQMTKKYNNQWTSEWHRAKIVLWMICEYLRDSGEENELGEWGTSVKELSLMGFQQRIGRKIPAEEEETNHRTYSMTPWAIAKREYRKKKQYSDYIEMLRNLREKKKSS